MTNSTEHSETPTKLTATEARQAQPMGVMRYVLLISLGLTVTGFIAAWVFGVF